MIYINAEVAEGWPLHPIDWHLVIASQVIQTKIVGPQTAVSPLCGVYQCSMLLRGNTSRDYIANTLIVRLYGLTQFVPYHSVSSTYVCFILSDSLCLCLSVQRTGLEVWGGNRYHILL